MMNKILAVILIAAPLFVCAQNKQAAYRWYNVTQYGMLLGKNYTTYSLQTINGVAYRQYSAGIGIAYDNYGYKSIPLFADLRYSLLHNKNIALQVYGNAGVNTPLRNEEYLPHKYNDGRVRNKLHESFYTEAGLSFSVPLVHSLSLIAGAGYNYKTFKYTGISYVEDIPTPELHDNYTYHYGKYVLRVGIGF